MTSMSMSRHPSAPPEDRFDEVEVYRRVCAALDVQRWAEARELLLDLARRLPHASRYRALLAYTRGQEALGEGDARRAREEWRRALILDPGLRVARQALAAHQRPSTWIGRLFRAG
jgi:predicted Zn-dependent protease